MPDPDLEVGEGGGGEGGHPDPEIRGGPSVSQFFFRLFGPHIALKLREGAPGGSATENNTL